MGLTVVRWAGKLASFLHTEQILKHGKDSKVKSKVKLSP
jgi:hypothetical protein